MANLKKGFLRQIKLKVSKPRLILGLFLGLAYSFSFYSLFYASRELFRLMSAAFNDYVWTLSNSEVGFYNLIFAYISVIFGFSFFVTFIFDRPKMAFETNRFLRTSIINDQRALMWYFLSWFSKLGVAFGILFGASGFIGGFYTFSFYPKYNFLFILIVIVLFLQSWVSIGKLFKRKSLRWMIISAFIISFISFGFSKINLYDYKGLNERLLNNKPHIKYHFQLPESDVYQSFEKLDLVENIYIVKPKGQPNSIETIVVINNKETLIDSIPTELNKLLLKKDEADRKFITFRLKVDKGIKTKIVDQVKFQITKLNSPRIAYAVIPSGHEYDEKYYRNYAINSRLYSIDSSSRMNLYRFIIDFKVKYNPIDIIQLDNGDCLINDSVVKLENVYSKIQDISLNSSNHYFKIFTNGKVDYAKYLDLITQIRKAVFDLANSYSLEKYSIKYDELWDREKRNDIIDKYPIRIIEFSDELLDYLNKNEKSKGANNG